MNTSPLPASLSDRTLLAGLTIRHWSGRRLDKRVTDETNAAHNAPADAGRYNKLLLPKDALADITAAVSQARNEFTLRTAPWWDRGPRIFDVAGYFDLMQWYNERRAAFESAVLDFEQRYPAYLAAAPARLNGMFDPMDYPAPDDIRSLFHMSLNISPTPAADDIRVDLPPDARDAIQHDIERRIAVAVQDATRDTVERVRAAVERMAARLRAYQACADKGERLPPLYATVTGNIQELATLLPTLNIGRDDRLTALQSPLETLGGIDVADIKADPDLCRKTAQAADQVLETMAAVFG